MRIEAYLRVVSDEATVRALHEETDVPGARIEKLKAPREGTANDYWWNWQTMRVRLDEDDVDRGVKALLEQYRSFSPAIKKHRGAEADIYLEVVTYCEEDERPRGLYLSAESISLLNELGAALDNDVVPEVLAKRAGDRG